MPFTLRPTVNPFTTVKYTPAAPAAFQLLGTFLPVRYEKLTFAYPPFRFPLTSNCAVPVFETTPPQITPVPGSRLPAYDSRLSFTLSRTALNVNGPPSGRNRMPPITF